MKYSGTPIKQKLSKKVLGSINNSKSLLVRLSQACIKHKSFHTRESESQSQINSNEMQEIPEKCQKDLQSLLKILPQIEAQYQISQNSRNSSFKITPNNILELCGVYRNIVLCYFCPHSSSLLSKNQVMIRVYQLFQHVVSNIIVNETVNNLITISPKMRNKQCKNSNPLFQISSTISHLFYSIMDPLFQKYIIKDLITLLHDTSTIIRSELMIHNDVVEKSSIEIVTFLNIQKDPHHEFIIKIPSYLGLLLLQTCIFHCMFLMIIYQHDNNENDAPVFMSEELKIHENLNFDLIHNQECSYMAIFFQDNELKRVFLTCMHTLLYEFQPLSYLQDYTDSISQPENILKRSLLIIQNQIMAANLLSLLLYDFSIVAGQNHSGTIIWLEICAIISQAVFFHLDNLSMDTTLSTFIIDVPCEKNEKKCSWSPYFEEVQNQMLEYSLILSVLLRDCVLCPLHPYCPSFQEMYDMQSNIILTLLDCLPHIDELLQFHLSNTQTFRIHIQLCQLVLRTIHVSFFPFNSFFSIPLEMKLQLHHSTNRPTQVLAHIMASRDGIFSALVNIVQNSFSSLTTISIAIMMKFFEGNNSHKGLFGFKNACFTILEQERALKDKKIEINDKKQKLQHKSILSTRILQNSETQNTFLGDSWLLVSITKIFETAYREAKKIIYISKSHKHDSKINSNKLLNNILSIALPSVGLTIVGALRLSDVFLSKNCSSNGRSSAEVGDIGHLVRTLYEALLHISDVMCHLAKEKRKIDSFQPKDLKHLLASMIGFVNQSFGHCADCKERRICLEKIQVNQIRKDVRDSISYCALINSCGDSELFQEETNGNINTCSINLNDLFDCPQQVTSMMHSNINIEYSKNVVSTLTLDNFLLLHQHKVNVQTCCHQYCFTIKSSFGVLPSKNNNEILFFNDCLCGLIGPKISIGEKHIGITEGSYLTNDCMLFLLEQVLSLQQRCILMACSYPVISKTEHENISAIKTCTSSPSTFKYLCKSIHTSSSLLSNASCITCLPLLLLTIWRKFHFKEQNDDSKAKYIKYLFNFERMRNLCGLSDFSELNMLNYLISVIDEIKFKEYFDMFLNNPKCIDEVVKITLYRLLLVCLSKMIPIYAVASYYKSFSVPFYLSEKIGSYSIMRIILFDDYDICGDLRECSQLDIIISSLHKPSSFQRQVIEIVQSSPFCNNNHFENPQIRKAKWIFIFSVCKFFPTDILFILFSCHFPSKREKYESCRRFKKYKDTTLSNTSDEKISSSQWILQTPFIDDNVALRLYSACRLGSLLFSNHFRLLFVIFNEIDKFELHHGTNKTTCDHKIHSRFFDEIDNLISVHFRAAESLNSFSAKRSPANQIVDHVCSVKSNKCVEGLNAVEFSYLTSAIHALSSICEHVDIESSIGKNILEKGVLRLVKFWVTFSDTTFIHLYLNDCTFDANLCQRGDVSAISFHEIQRLNDHHLIGVKLLKNCKNTFLPNLFAEILSHCNSAGVKNSNTSNFTVTTSYKFLMLFIQYILIRGVDTIIHWYDKAELAYTTLSFTKQIIPIVITGLLIEQDYETLKSCTGFYHFLVNELEKTGKRMSTISELVEGKYWGKSSIGNEKNLNRKASALCLMDKEGMRVLDTILPRLLLEPTTAPLIFFLQTVLHSKVSLKEMMEKKELKILEELMWELGKNTEDVKTPEFAKTMTHWSHEVSEKTTYAMQALKKCVLILKNVSSAVIKESHISHGQESLTKNNKPHEEFDMLYMDDSKADLSDAVIQWIQKHFMMLLVNVVTIRWKKGGIDEKLQSLRCLAILMRFLKTNESPKYITQVLTIIDSAMTFSFESFDIYNNLSEILYLAIKALSSFINILIICDHIKVIGENLCKIVICLFPLFHYNMTTITTTKRINHNTINHNEAVREAISLLELLVKGKHGMELRPYFSYLPFFPYHESLEQVRTILKQMRIYSNDLFILYPSNTIHHTQNDLSLSQTTTNNKNAVDKKCDKRKIDNSSQMQTELALRLHKLISLFDHESSNVRYVVLNHLTDLLHTHRALFYSLVNNEVAPMQFLTVIRKGQSKTLNNNNNIDPTNCVTPNGVGTISSLFQGLLSRCVLETLPANRIALATCLGEIGALDPNLVGRDLTACVNFDSLTKRHEWFLIEHAPWKSQSVEIHYELQLVTKIFVSALKAAPTSMDQHKIAFAIQEVLQLLDSRLSTCIDIKNDEHSLDDEKKSTCVIKSSKVMNSWLQAQLEKAGVLELIEPFWSSQYRQREALEQKNPPFFKESRSYYSWISTWGRFLIERSYMNQQSPLKNLFYSCRSAIRSEAGVGVMEFLLPLLVLDSICFGENTDKKYTVDEMLSALSCGHQPNKMTKKADLQKSIASIFMVIDTLKAWCDNEIEDRYRAQRGTPSVSFGNSNLRMPLKASSSDWSADGSIGHIENILNTIPLTLCTKAAAYARMYARSLLYLEMEGREKDVQEMFNVDNHDRDVESCESNNHEIKTLIGRSYLHGMDCGLTQSLFAELDDLDSMETVANYRKKSRQEVSLTDRVHEKETYGDWSGVLQCCDQASQISNVLHNETIKKWDSDHKHYTEKEKKYLEKYQLRALLQLGQLESTLNQVKGMIFSEIYPLSYVSPENHEKKETLHIQQVSHGCRDRIIRLLPFAVEASWRLSRWDYLDELVNSPLFSMHESEKNGIINWDGQYQLCLGMSMLGLYLRHEDMVKIALRVGRESVMNSISATAQENYSRSFPHMIKLHCLREIEDACFLFMENTDNLSPKKLSFLATSDIPGSWAWNHRLEAAGRNIAVSLPIVNIRLALLRLDSKCNLEGNLWLKLVKKARKGGLYHIASNALVYADACLIKRRKQYDKNGDGGLHNVYSDLEYNTNEVLLQGAKIKHIIGKSAAAIQVLDRDYAHNYLNVNEDLMLNSLKGIKNEEEKRGFAKRNLQITEWIVKGGLKCETEVMRRYCLLQKVLPKWEKVHFSFARYLDSLLNCRINTLSSDFGRKFDDDKIHVEVLQNDHSCQKYIIEAIKEYGEALKHGEKHVFQALPRLLTLWFDFTSIDIHGSISQDLSVLQHEVNEIAASYIKSIPSISYYTAIPQLISRIGHKNEDTSNVVVAILKRILTKFPAQGLWPLAWLRHSIHPERQEKGEEIFKGAQRLLQKYDNLKMHDLLVASKSLFKFLMELAKYKPKQQDSQSFNVRQWTGDVDLKDFIPPIKAALTRIKNMNFHEAFPPFIPRMRSFDSRVQIMSSKARPKKLIAYAIPGGSLHNNYSTSSSLISNDSSQAEDIGEMHFLVKQEIRGDLRKDARMQDLNNVINRLFASSQGSGHIGSRQHRRLHLRTFSVVCLSEDCGILEWVPNTDSFRNLVANSYNPQAAHDSSRRRGRQVICLNDTNFRTKFEKCQDMYIKKGNLVKAGKMFQKFLINYPPVLYWWFMKKFHEPHRWFEARTKFTLSTAIWSAVGHVIGLGDRHSENILVDVSNGECVHVDFDCIFDKGLHLPRPEVVPFRLTPNIIDAFGPIGCEGAYSGSLTAAVAILRENRDILLSVLEPFLKDPIIDWKRQRAQQKEKNICNKESVEAKRSIKVIDGRLKGVYNLKNPNLKKIKRTDGYSVDFDDDNANILPLSVEGQVQKMIHEASSYENLVQLYVGWMPWL